MRTFRYHSRQYKICTYIGLAAILIAVFGMMLSAIANLLLAKIIAVLAIIILIAINAIFPKK